MKKFKRMVSMLLALSISASMSLVSYAAEPKVSASINSEGEIVYTQVYVLNEAITPYVTPVSRTVRNSKSLGLALGPGKSGTSSALTFQFSVPQNAIVKSIDIEPGTATINGGPGSILTGAILITDLTLTSPQGKSANFVWDPKKMTDKKVFLNESARGAWTVTVSGRNLAQPTGDQMIDDRNFGGLLYKNNKMTITYITQ